MTVEYKAAAQNAAILLLELGAKLAAGKEPTPREGESILNANWKVYLIELAEGRIYCAMDTHEFIEVLLEYMRLMYCVKFTNRYEVSEKC